MTPSTGPSAMFLAPTCSPLPPRSRGCVVSGVGPRSGAGSGSEPVGSDPGPGGMGVRWIVMC